MQTSISRVNLIYFSATNSTKSIVKSIAENLAYPQTKEYNLTEENKTLYESKITKDSLSLIGIPVYKGRVPLVIVEKLKQLRSDHSPAVIIAVYGNRHYDDALLELRDISQQCGFNIIAGATFIGEHSYSTNEHKIAHKRPDKKDYAQCHLFAQELKAKIKSTTYGSSMQSLHVPGNYPYKALLPAPLLSPETIAENCTLCEICADACPTNAIRINNSVSTQKSACIWCCACIKACPTQARIFRHELINNFSQKLSELCKQRREPEWFM